METYSSAFSCTDDAFDIQLQEVISGLLPHAAVLWQILVNNAGGLRSTWIALLAAAGAATTSKDGSEVASRACRVALQLELFKNLLTLALNFPNDVSMCALLSAAFAHASEPAPARFAHGQCGVERGLNHFEFTLHASHASSFNIRTKLGAAASYTVLIEGLEASGDDAIYQCVPTLHGQYMYIVTAHNGTGDGPASAPVTVNAT